MCVCTHIHSRGWHFFGNHAGWETKLLWITWLGRDRKKYQRSRNSVSSAAWYAFNSFFFCKNKRHTTFTSHDLADFYIEGMTAHRIKINYYLCFHNRRPNSKTKLKLKYLWEQGGPWCFGGPTQLAYSAKCLLLKCLCGEWELNSALPAGQAPVRSLALTISYILQIKVAQYIFWICKDSTFICVHSE